MGKKLLTILLIWLGIALGVWALVSRMSFMDTGFSAKPSEPVAPSGPAPNTEMALEVSAAQREISDFLVSAQNAELSDEQVTSFESALRRVYASPLKEATRATVSKYGKTLPLFTASEQALFACLRGRASDPKACEPSPRYRKLLKEGVASGDITGEEADKYLDILKSMKDPARRPPLPDGGLDFMEKESAMRTRNFEKIAAAVRRVEQAPSQPTEQNVPVPAQTGQ